MIAVALATVCFLLVEVALQVRSHVRFGQSVLSRVQTDPNNARDSRTGLRLLPPNQTSGGSLQLIRSNSFGLRSPEITLDKPEGTVRIAVLGASTVFGAYAPSNEATFPGRLERLLRERFPALQIEVINAGIPGFGLAEQTQLFQRLVADFKPDITIVYPGFNDFGAYCRSDSSEVAWRPQPLATLGLPNWLLSVELLLKNTVAVRTLPPGLQPLVDASSLDLSHYRVRLNGLLAALKAQGTEVIISRNTRSYRPEQPLDVQLDLSTTARFYNPCFDLLGLHRLYEMHNTAISEEAQTAGVTVVPLDALVPGGRDYFADASHFSARGEQLVSEVIAKALSPRLTAWRKGDGR